jgi:hypothetical protein
MRKFRTYSSAATQYFTDLKLAINGGRNAHMSRVKSGKTVTFT